MTSSSTLSKSPLTSRPQRERCRPRRMHARPGGADHLSDGHHVSPGHRYNRGMGEKPRAGTKSNRLRIAERDGWVCGICSLPIDSTLSPFESDQAASIDHIIPRIAGGSHDDDNLQISHLACNYRKGTSGYHRQRAARIPQPVVRKPKTEAEWDKWAAAQRH